MNTKHIATISLLINAPSTRVWEALTSPDLINTYFYGTHAESEWKEGSTLTFSGSWEGKAYLDKGIILVSNPPTLFQYSYLSSWSNLPDVPENYAIISYKLSEDKGVTLLTVTQTGIATEEAKKHSEENWKTIMGQMKKLIE